MACAMGMVWASSAAPTLLLNGDFEAPVQPPGTFLPVGSVIPGWTVIGSGGVNVDHVQLGTPYWSGNTSQFMDLTGNTGGAGVISDPIATIAGLSYAIVFDAFNGSLIYPGAPETGPALSVQASGSPVGNYNGTLDLPPGVPVTLTYYFTAAAASTTLTFLDISGYDSNAGWIDNVSIQVVPEPSSVLLFGAMLAPIAVRAFRKSRS